MDTMCRWHGTTQFNMSHESLQIRTNRMDSENVTLSCQVLTTRLGGLLHCL